MAVFATLCLIVGILPGLFIDALAPVVSALVGDRMPMQTGIQWLSIVPIAESRSSYNGLLVFLFIVASASLAAVAIHRLASDVVRRAPAWDCGFPDANPATQYTADSFAEPIRRVFGGFRLPRPRPGRHAGAGRHAAGPLEGRDATTSIWEAIYLPIVGIVGAISRSGSTGCSSSPSGNI